MTAQLSVLLTCKNEERNIGECLASVRPIADEIVVADSGSTDGTLDIVRHAGGCRIIEREYVNSGNFKNWAIPQCRHEWVLIVDCDERVTPALAGEIRRIMALDGPLDGYWIRRDNFWLGRRVRYSGWGSDQVIRLFRRDMGRYDEYTDHSEMSIASGQVGRLCARLEHHGVVELEGYLSRMVRYAGQQARLWKARGRRPSLLALCTSGPIRFCHSYVVRGGFLDGVAGLQVSALTGFYSFLKQVRLWELYYGPLADDAASAAPTSSAEQRRAA